MEELGRNKKATVACCQHFYCYACIKKWTDEGANTCPVCKKKIT